MKYLKMLNISLMILTTLSSGNTIFAQETISEESEITTVETELLPYDETIEESTEVINQPEISVDYLSYIPYITFVNYQYQGDGSIFNLQDIIMEYTPDNDGIFQIAAFYGNNATAYVYQMSENGLYELAKFDDYNMVEDLRYTEVAKDASKSLVFPKNVKVGEKFQSGYANEIQREVVDLLPTYTLGGMTFNQVLVIREDNSSTGESLIYYYAPDYGLILIERETAEGQVKVVQLISTQGSITE